MPLISSLSPEIQIDDQTYRLAREQVLGRFDPAARRWRAERKPAATKVEQRPDVRPSGIADEYVITWRNEGLGLGTLESQVPGTIHYAINVDHRFPGLWRDMPLPSSTQDNTLNWEGPAVKSIRFRNRLYLLAGRYVFDITGTQATDRDTGASHILTDGIVWNGELVVGFGGATNKIQKANSSGTWSEASDAVYADYFANVLNVLWRATATNQVSNIASAANPFTLTNWSAGISVGDANAITSLAPFGERLAVAEAEGLHLGDSGAVFPKVLAVPPHHRNGTNLIDVGGDLLFNNSKLYWKYSNGNAQEIGPSRLFTDIQRADDPPGLEITAATSLGNMIFIATEPSTLPHADPTGFEKTVNTGTAYTSYLTNVTDNSGSTSADLSSLDTVANGDWIVIGYSAAFYGFMLNMVSPNLNTSTMTVQYWNGTAWTAMTTYSPAVDRTAVSGISLRESNWVGWRTTPGDWATSAINGITAYWVRVSFSAALSSSVTISECRILTQAPRSYVFMGRPRQIGDVYGPIVWFAVQSATTGVGPLITSLDVVDFDQFGVQLVAGGYQTYQKFTIPLTTHADYVAGVGGAVHLASHNGGMPEVNKQFLDFTIKGRRFNGTVTVGYRTDENSSWTTAITTTTSPTTTALSNITGRAIQPYISFASIQGDGPVEVTELECRFRVLPTMKNEYTAILEVADGQGLSDGGVLPDAAVQLSNLETAHAKANVAVIDPVGRSKTVTVSGMRILEALQSGVDYPMLLVEVTMAEL